MSQPRIGINAHLLSAAAGYRRAGIHRYSAELINHLPAGPDEPAYTVFTNAPAELAGRPGIQTVAAPWPTAGPLGRILWEQLVWPPVAVAGRLDLLHSLSFATPLLRPCPAVATVYDLSFVLYPELYPPLQRWYLRSQTRRSCRSARRVVAISEAGRRDVARLFGVAPARIDVVPPGVDAHFGPRPAAEVEAFRQRQGLPAEVILHVGTLQPRKNLALLAEAVAQLGRPDVALVFVGGKGWHYEPLFERVRALGLEGQARFTGYVADSDLALWYNAASVLALPSVYEGFGLPLIQAMACGTPLVAANSSSLPEVVGPAGLLFDPQDSQALARCLAAVLDEPELAAALRAAGLE
ncbi:MAG: glycosyltransferase family 4 protein, partial [Candidatus Promineifilaceae bacterium]